MPAIKALGPLRVMCFPIQIALEVPQDLFGLHIELSSTIGPQMATHMAGIELGGSASAATNDSTAKHANKVRQ